MANRITTCIHPGTRQNKFIVQQLQLKNTSTNGKQDMAIAVNGSRPASYIGHVVSNRTNFNLPVGAVSVNVGMNLTNLNLKLAPSQPMPCGGSTKPASCCNRTIALPAYARAHSSTSGLTTPRWPDTDCVAFATSTTGGRWVWSDVLGTSGEILDIPYLAPPHFYTFLRSCVMMWTLLRFFVTD